MASSMTDSKPNIGLANSLSNVFKLADVSGLKWVRYVGLNSNTLEAPKDDLVLTSYARLLNQGYACSWRRQSPSTDGLTGETKDLWVFYFTDLPDIAGTLAQGLKEDGSGSWEDGMTSESSTMLYRSLHNIIERSLIGENFLPLGKWLVRPDSSVATDGSSRGCFLCGFSFFVHAHLYICASVDMKAGPSLQPLLSSHINQALASSTGLQVILSPSGLNAFMTGHSYKTSDSGISEILEEWKLFYPGRFDLEPSPSLPAAIEVVLGGVRMRYPSQFVFVYHGDDMPAPPPCSLGEKNMEDVMQETWITANCVDTLQQQRDSALCRCTETRSSLRRPSTQLDLSLNTRHTSSGRYKPYSQRNRAKELATPGSLNLMNQPALTANKLRGQRAVPKYTTPMSSPGLLPSLSPTVHGKLGTTSASSMGMSLPLPSISLNSAPTTTSSSGATPVSISTCPKSYDQSKVPPSYLKSSSPYTTTTTSTNSVSKTFPAQQQQQQQTEEWWDSLALPESLEALGGLQLPRFEGPRMRANGSLGSLGSPGLTPNSLSNLISPNSAKKTSSSPKGRNKGSIDHSSAGTPLRGAAISPGGNLFGPPFPGSNGAKRRASISKANGGGRGKGRGKKGVELGYLGYTGMEDGFEGLDSPMSTDGGDTGHQQVNGMNGESMDELFPSKPHGIDVFSDKAVKIEATSLDQIFDSDEEEEESLESSHFPFMDPATGLSGEEKMNGSMLKSTKLSASEPIELSRIYPTPPSVEADEGDKFEEVKMTRTDGNDNFVTGFLLDSCLDDDLSHVPPDFLPLPDLLCFSTHYQLPQQLTYHKTTAKTTPSSSMITSNAHKENCLTAHSYSSEPEKFIFPPVLTSSRTLPAKESLTLPLTQQHRQTRFSPHIFTPHAVPSNLSSLGSSPAYPYPRAPGRLAHSRHHPSATVLTPLESPFEPMVTPTPMSATTNRLIPVLPEANGLYINLALLDSALGSNLSETLQISNAPLLSTIQNFMKFSSKRMKLDSVADTFDNSGVGSTTDLLNCQDEKPMMTFGIADYPSLGFKEELAGVGAMPQNTGSCDTLYGSLSKFIFNMEKSRSTSDPDAILSSFPMERFLEMLQDYCLHVCLTCHQNDTNNHTSFQERKQHAHLLRQPDRSDDLREKSLCRLYYSHSVVSAILSAKQLVVSSKKGGGMGTPLISKGVTLTREDNSGTWILDLLTLPTKFITKRLKELKSVLQNSFHHAPCLKFTTKGPLTLKDLQQLTPSMTALGDECLPLPIKPVVVGYDHEWLSVSPLALPSWDKLLLEPYAMRKSVVYLVVIPPTISNGSSLTLPLKKYFRDLSLVYKNCHLGQHLPLEKGIGEEGIILATCPPTKEGTTTSPSPETSSAGEMDTSKTDDPNTNTRHGDPAGVGDVCQFCKKVLVSYLSSLPNDPEEIISNYTPSVPQDRNGKTVSTPETPPLSIVLYVLCNNLQHVANPVTPASRLDPDECAANNATRLERMECLRIMKAFSELLDNGDMPAFILERLVVQLLDPKELMGSSSGCSGQLRSLAFSVYTRCRPQAVISIKGSRSLCTFGPIADRSKHDQVYPYRQIHAPPYILSSEPPLTSIGPLIGTQTHHILLDPDEPVLFCGYCVSPDRRWMLVVCSDRQGELLDTSIIGIPYTGGFDIDNSRFMALQKLWAYLVSLVSSSLHRWSIVITRFGKPSTSEISNWPSLIVDDGLLTANQVLRDDCAACTHTSSRPHISNVIILSVQPERNIQLFPTSDPTPSVSHVIVLPQDPSAAPPPGMTPSAVPDQQDDALGDIFGGGMAAGGDMAMDVGGIDFGSELSGINIHEEIQNLGYSSGTEDTSPKATGYLISTSPPGDLPMEFWGHDRPQSFCSMFKVLLHCHRSEKAIPDSPQETLGSTLLCFDALSWLTMDHSTRQRRTCLPIHLFILSKLYHLFSTLEQN